MGQLLPSHCSDSARAPACGRGTREEIFPRHRANSVRALAASPVAGMAAATVWFRGSCVSQSCGSRDGNPEVSPRAICGGLGDPLTLPWRMRPARGLWQQAKITGPKSAGPAWVVGGRYCQGETFVMGESCLQGPSVVQTCSLRL